MNLNVKPIYLGTFSVGLDKKFYRINRDDSPQKASLKLSMNPFLIQYDKKNIIIDPGLGDLDQESHIPALLEGLHEHGLSNDDITDVFLSHLHFDHIGGLANKQNGFWELTFPNATVWLSRQEWDKLKTIPQKNPIKEQFIDFVDIHADMHFVHDNDKPFDGVTVRVIGGHTEFSLAWFINLGGYRLLNAGDVLGTKGHIHRKFAAKYDFDGKVSQQRRDELIAMAMDEDYIFLAFHDNEIPVFKIKEKNENNAYILQEVTEFP
jgi:glyoxylase-like metal-dependent hydrolase (beta-lactamase superfamily II)